MSKHLSRAAAIAASALAGTTIMMAPPAQASTTVWDRVAECESSGNWSINTGNGFYGGLQFTQSTWNAFGGQEFASRADLATKSEQITVAQRVLEVQGPGAWPICSQKAGLTRTNGDASSYSPSYATTSSSASDSDSDDKSSSASSSEESSSKAEHAEKRAEAKAERKAKQRARLAALAEAKAERKADKVAERNERKATKASSKKVYTVKSGDSLWKIANKYDIDGGWEALYELNSKRIDDADRIYPGQKLKLS